MTAPKFNNRLNEECEAKDGTILWKSRSVALLGVIFFEIDGIRHVLIGKRSKKMDAPCLWCVPSGYIDWDENGIEGMRREVYEEAGIFLPDLEKVLLYKDAQPFYVHTTPGENRQNITLSYSASYDLDIDKDLKKRVAEAILIPNDEVVQTKLIPVDQLHRYPWAFDHDKRIKQALDHIEYKMIEDEIRELAAESVLEKLKEIEIEKSYRRFDNLSFWQKILVSFGAKY